MFSFISNGILVAKTGNYVKMRTKCVSQFLLSIQKPALISFDLSLFNLLLRIYITEREIRLDLGIQTLRGTELSTKVLN